MRKERSAAQAAKKSVDRIAGGKLDFPALCELHATATTLTRCGFILEKSAIEAVRHKAETVFDALVLPQVNTPPSDDVVSAGFITADLPFVRAVMTFDAFYLALSAAAGDWALRYRSGLEKRVPCQSKATAKVDGPLDKSGTTRAEAQEAPEEHYLEAPVAHLAQPNSYQFPRSPKIVLPRSARRLPGHLRPSFSTRAIEPETSVDDD